MMQELTEEIVLLRLLTAEPARPSRIHVLADEALSSSISASRTLSFANERDIVDSLTFLSATSDDPEKVIAICLEEGPQSDSCIIRIAMNCHKLDGLVACISHVTRILERADRGSEPGAVSCHRDIDLTAHQQVMVTISMNY